MLSSLLKLSFYPAIITGFLISGIWLLFTAFITTPIAFLILYTCWFFAHLRPVSLIIYSCLIEYGTSILSYITRKLRLRRQPTTTTPAPKLAITHTPQSRSHHSSRRSSFNSVTSVDKPRLPIHKKSQSYSTIPLTYSGTATPRDFEGIGGWRDQGDDDEEQLWLQLNSRLEYPRRPSVGSNSGRVSPEVARSPAALMRQHRKNRSGTASPEEYFVQSHHAGLGARLRHGSDLSLTSVVGGQDGGVVG